MVRLWLEGLADGEAPKEGKTGVNASVQRLSGGSEDPMAVARRVSFRQGWGFKAEAADVADVPKESDLLVCDVKWTGYAGLRHGLWHTQTARVSSAPPGGCGDCCSRRTRPWHRRADRRRRRRRRLVLGFARDCCGHGHRSSVLVDGSIKGGDSDGAVVRLAGQFTPRRVRRRR